MFSSWFKSFDFWALTGLELDAVSEVRSCGVAAGSHGAGVVGLAGLAVGGLASPGAH